MISDHFLTAGSSSAPKLRCVPPCAMALGIPSSLSSFSLIPFSSPSTFQLKVFPTPTLTATCITISHNHHRNLMLPKAATGSHTHLLLPKAATGITVSHTHQRNLLLPKAATDDDDDWGDCDKFFEAILYLLPNQGHPPNMVAGKLRKVLGIPLKHGKKALIHAKNNGKEELLKTDLRSAKQYQRMLLDGDVLVDTEVITMGYVKECLG
ncbi:hypothetical protein V6N13_031456 [Hibiscus sabdariffa]|uniref:Uncharacterized protein n=2 Tax=Hibiscus sabdariffa TaxID=183260 RepID=A0ABR2CK94_9ROSI